MQARDTWHKANTTENSVLFAQTFMTGFSLTDLNWNFRKLMFTQVPGEARVTQSILFTAEGKKAILDRREVQSKAEVIAHTQAAQGQILREVSEAEPQAQFLQRACEEANIPLIRIGDIFELKEASTNWPALVGTEMLAT